MIYKQLETRQDLMEYFDNLQYGARKLIEKVGTQGYSAETFLKMMVQHISSEDCFILVVLDDDLKFKAFMFALHVNQSLHPWTEVIGIWSEPKIGMKVKNDVNKLFEGWCRIRGATKIVTYVHRRLKHDREVPGMTFYKIWHKPIGYQIAGVMLEKVL